MIAWINSRKLNYKNNCSNSLKSYMCSYKLQTWKLYIFLCPSFHKIAVEQLQIPSSVFVEIFKIFVDFILRQKIKLPIIQPVSITVSMIQARKEKVSHLLFYKLKTYPLTNKKTVELILK